MIILMKSNVALIIWPFRMTIVALMLRFVVSTVSLSLSHWYPGSGVVLDCIDS